MSGPEDAILSLDNPNRPFLTLIRNELHDRATLISHGNGIRDPAWTPFSKSGFRRLFETETETVELPEGSGKAAEQWWEKSGWMAASTRMVLLLAAAEFELFWIKTGAPCIANAIHFRWLADAYISDVITVDDYLPHLLPRRIEALVFWQYQLIRHFALFCQQLPADHSAFAIAARKYKPWKDFPRFGQEDFDARVQANATSYWKTIRPEFRRAVAGDSKRYEACLDR